METYLKYMYHGEPISLTIKFKNKEEMNKYNLSLLRNKVNYLSDLSVEVFCNRELDEKVIPVKNINNQIKQFADIGIITEKMSLVFENQVDNRLISKYLLLKKEKYFPFIKKITTDDNIIILKQFFFDPFFKEDIITISGLRDYSLNLDAYHSLLKDVWIFFNKKLYLSDNQEEILKTIKIILKEIKKAKEILNNTDIDDKRERYRSNIDFSDYLSKFNKELIFYLKKESD